MSLVILAKSSYITSANTVFYNMKDYKHSLYLQANILDYVKCCLLRSEQLQDFNIDGINVYVYANGDSYDLYYDDYCMSIDVYDKMIVGMDLIKS